MYDPNAIKIYTDGSAMPNPGKGGVGIVVEFPDSLERNWECYSIGFKLSTNNRMELMACIEAVRWLNESYSIYKFNRALIITDSEYVYENHKNIHYWKSNGWKTKEGRSYENVDLWTIFLKEKLRLRVPLDILWEKGKTRPILVEVDKQAKNGAKNAVRVDTGYRPGKFTMTRTGIKKAALLYENGGKDILMRVYKKSSNGDIKNPIFKISFDLYDTVQTKYIGKYFAYITDPKIILHRNNCYKVCIEINSKFPLIIESDHIDYLK